MALAFPGIVRSQSPPDAGSLLQQIEQQRQPVLPPRAPQIAPPAPLRSLPGPTVTVASFRFVGNTLLSDSALTPVVAGFVGRPLDFATLQNAAIAVADAYRKAGWVVRAYLPQQDISGGVVSIQIVEAVFGAVHVDGDVSRISAAALTRIVESAQVPGAPLNGDSLDRALLLIDDLHGVTAGGRLVEGQNQAETDLVLTVANGPFATGNLTADNGGARATGPARLTAQAVLNSPLSIGDQGDLLLMHSRGSDYLRSSFSLPVGSGGLRIDVHGAHLAYRVVAAEFTALDAHGTSTTGGVAVTYPLVRSPSKNLYVSFALDSRHFHNRLGIATSSRYQVQAADLGVYGNAFDGVGGGGANSASLGLQQGRLDLDGSPSQAADAASTRSAGSFQKLHYALSRQQAVTDSASLFAGITGQFANKNLDSSEKFYLGGPTGVRAYPVSEAGGSQGMLVNLEARMRLPAGFSGTGFFDWGAVQANRDNDIAGAARPNRYSLKGAGVSIGWTAAWGLGVRATWAHRLGTNPNPTATGDDQDGSLTKNRFWLQASLPL